MPRGMSVESALDPLDLRIVAALQIDPRASWRRIAAALRVPERQVSRRGTALLAQRWVVTAALRAPGEGLVLRGSCLPGTRAAAAEALALRPDTSFSYQLSGPYDVAAEITGSPIRLVDRGVGDFSITPGLSRLEALPVLKYFRTVRGWRIGALDDSEARALQTGERDREPIPSIGEQIDPVDEAIIAALIDDARVGVEELARRAGVSETTARRRLERVLARGDFSLRALVEPGAVGFHVEALLWLRVAPGLIDEIGTRIAAEDCARYVAAVAGSCQIVADMTLADTHQLYRLLTGSSWSSGVDSLDVSVLLSARKRGGQLVAPGA